jgi:hypothetical protein
MPIAQPQPKTSAFQSQPTAYELRGQSLMRAERVPATVPPAVPTHRPTSKPAPQPKLRVDSAWIVFLLLASSIAFAIGLAYLWGHALEVKEGYRRVQLQRLLQHEREMDQQWRHLQAILSTPAHIEARAQARGMLRADDRKTITVGEIRK